MYDIQLQLATASTKPFRRRWFTLSYSLLNCREAIQLSWLMLLKTLYNFKLWYPFRFETRKSSFYSICHSSATRFLVSNAYYIQKYIVIKSMEDRKIFCRIILASFLHLSLSPKIISNGAAKFELQQSLQFCKKIGWNIFQI